MSERITIELVFRYDKKFDRVEMFYYDEHKTLVCFSIEEGHGEASYEYYRSLQHTNDCTPPIQAVIDNIIKCYENSDTKLRVMKRLKYRVCSY